MASDIPGFQAELTAAIEDHLDPEIDGLENFTNASISTEAKETVASALQDRVRRRDLQRAVLKAIQELVADGYPTRPKALTRADLFVELTKEFDAMAEAIKVFEEIPPAAKMELTLGEITKKETTNGS